MIRILLTGAAGKMGRALASLAQTRDEFAVNAGIDINAASLPLTQDFPVFSCFSECNIKSDIIIDFSHHTALEGILVYAQAEHLPVIIATTGHTAAELSLIHSAKSQIPIFYSRNMSLGINVLIELVRRAASALGGFDIEIVERHHNRKIDAPSGTAYMLADAASDALTYPPHYQCGRQTQRSPGEIGIHAVRGGTIVGDHEVIFAGHDEIITLSHSAQSREIFAEGALCAAAYLIGKPPGLYNMHMLLSEHEGER